MVEEETIWENSWLLCNEIFFVTRHCVGIFGISTIVCGKILVQVSFSCVEYEESRLLSAHTLIVSTYRATFALCIGLFASSCKVAVTEQCVYVLCHFPVCADWQRRSLHARVWECNEFCWIERSASFAGTRESLYIWCKIILCHKMLSGWRQGSLFGMPLKSWLILERKGMCALAIYVRSGGEVFDITVREVIAVKLTAGDVDVKRWVWIVLVEYRPGPRNTLEEPTDAVSSLPGSSADFIEPAENISIISDGILRRDVAWNFRDLTSKDGRGPSVLPRVQKFLKHTFCRSVWCAVQTRVNKERVSFISFCWWW